MLISSYVQQSKWESQQLYVHENNANQKALLDQNTIRWPLLFYSSKSSGIQVRFLSSHMKSPFQRFLGKGNEDSLKPIFESTEHIYMSSDWWGRLNKILEPFICSQASSDEHVAQSVQKSDLTLTYIIAITFKRFNTCKCALIKLHTCISNYQKERNNITEKGLSLLS